MWPTWIDLRQFWRVGNEHIEAAGRLCPLPVDPGLMDFFLGTKSPLVDDRQQAVANAVGKSLESFGLQTLGCIAGKQLSAGHAG